MFTQPVTSLKVVFIRHGEKPEKGDNLSPEGLLRALQLPAVLVAKFGVPNYIYVPSLGMDVTTAHARMFQTVTPLAVHFNLTINSKFDEKDATGLADHIRKKTGTALVVWEHHMIPKLVSAIGLESVPQWDDSDFDSIWIVTFNDHGGSVLTMDRQYISPL